MKQELQQQQLESSQQWVEKIVVGLNLCPFAKPVIKANGLRYALTQSVVRDELIAFFLAELELISNANELTIATSLVIYPNALGDFYDYLDFVAQCEELLAQAGLNAEFQIASFHPDYQFAGVSEDDVSHWTNRSPFPMLHLIREAQMSRVLANHPNPDSIPERNIELLREMGKKAILQLTAKT
ncbi:MAG: DUF1415 domain-containing protein [Oceanospirillaceae bacterium]